MLGYPGFGSYIIFISIDASRSTPLYSEQLYPKIELGVFLYLSYIYHRSEYSVEIKLPLTFLKHKPSTQPAESAGSSLSVGGS